MKINRKLLLRIAVALFAFAVGVAVVGLMRVARRVKVRAAANVRAEFRVPSVRPAPVPVPSPVPEAVEEWEPPQSPRHTARLLEAGEFHGDEVQARSGERWLGLYLTKKGSLLMESILTVAAVRDNVVDDDDSRVVTGKRVSVNLQPVPVLLVKGARGLQPGSVSTVFNGRLPLPNRTGITLTLGGETYVLDVHTKDTSREPYIIFNDAKLVLTKEGAQEQVLYDLGGRGGPAEAYWELLWAGDLDGDAKLDLYVQVSYHYNVSQRKLFLSSQAKKGKLVREVAELMTTGC